MQRERSALNSFPEPIDLNRGSLPDNTPMDDLASCNNMLNPVENQLSNYMLGSIDRNVTCINAANETAQSFSGLDHGESISGTDNMQDGACGGDSKMRLGWSSSFNACTGLAARSEDWSFEPTHVSSSSYAGNPVTGRSLSTQNYSNHGSINLNLDQGHSWDLYCHRGSGAGLPHNAYKCGHPEMEQIPTFYASSSNTGTLSGSSSTSSENYDATGPTSSWGSSCKRKALECTSGKLYPGGSSNSHQPTENIKQHPIPSCYSASGSLNISSGQLNLSQTNSVEQLNPTSGVGISRIAPSLFPSSSVPAMAETAARTIRLDHGRHGSAPFDTPRGTSLRNSGVNVGQLSRPITNMDSSDLRSLSTLLINENSALNQSHLMHSTEARGMHSYPWNGSFGSRGGSSSSYFMISGERASGAHEEVNIRSSHGNILDYPMSVSAPETRNVMHDQIDWSFTPGTSTSRNHPYGSHIGASTGDRTYSGAWLPHQNHTFQNHQRLSESFSWIPSNHVEPQSGERRSHFSLLPSSSSLLDEAASTSHAHHQLDQRFLMDRPDVNGWHALAAVEGRHRLIRQVLNGNRRGAHLQAEDYMLIDPFINGFDELHDRHRDMRLDVDNMSYEELLALEERIGNVSTGLSEEKIRDSMKQHKYEEMRGVSNLEPCCICQEDYATGDDIGILVCGHEFHTSCIKQWLMLKNMCPICKMTALGT